MSSDIRRILVTRLRFLGDVILTTPLLDTLRAAFPDARIEYLVSEPFDQLLLEHPSVDEIHVLPRKASIGKTLDMARHLRAPRIDWWIDLLTNPRSCMLALLANPRQSVGSDRGLRSRVYGHRRGRPQGNPTAIEHHLDKLFPLVHQRSRVTQPRLYLSDAELEAAQEQHSIEPNEKPILLHAGNTWPDKAWPLDSWRQLIASLRELHHGPLWMLTPPGEADMARDLAAGCNVKLIGAMSLRELLALLALSRLYIGNDGGILHASIALGTPSLGLFGPTDPSIWFPYPDATRFRVLHEYNAAGHCEIHGEEHVSRLAHLPPQHVIEAALELLGRRERADA